MPQSRVASRPVCGRCARPLAGCLCRWTRPVANRIEVLILQDPGERKSPKGSARLLEMSLTRCETWVGEDVDAARLAQHLARRGGCGSARLLYPSPDRADSQACESLGTSGAPMSGAVRAESPVQCLIVLDATWRKAHRMVCRNPFLSQLRRVAIENPPPSRYLIRRARRADQLSTLEATCLGLMQCGESGMTVMPLLHLFEGFVAQVAARMPALHATTEAGRDLKGR
jgi:DTW domain-containing protein